MAIVKILSRHTPSYTSLIRYILKEGKTDISEVFTHNLRSDTIEGFAKEFAENESYRKQSRSDQIYLYHEIISFNAGEDNRAISPEIINDMAWEYIRLRGHEGVMLGAVHRDKEHVHIHICVSALKFRTGTSFGLSKVKLMELKQSFQQYHKQAFPEISKSFPEHGKGKPYVKNAQWYALQKEQRAFLKGQITATVRSCFDRAASKNSFLELLLAENLHHYNRNGSVAGIERDGIKFRFSRILEQGQLETLPVDLTEEEKALAEISNIREQRAERDRDNRDMEDIAR